MKKILAASFLSLAMATGAMAEDYSFEPVEISTPPATTTVTQTQAPKATTTATTQTVDEGSNFQNALLQLDSAQVDLRDQLLEHKNKYAEVDAQYNKYKTERENLNKTIKQTEKKIKNIDKYKKNIRKDMI